MSQPAQIAGRTVDLSHPEVAFLADYVLELEREVELARKYLEQCRRAVGAREQEMLIVAIKRRLS